MVLSLSPWPATAAGCASTLLTATLVEAGRGGGWVSNRVGSRWDIGGVIGHKCKVGTTKEEVLATFEVVCLPASCTPRRSRSQDMEAW